MRKQNKSMLVFAIFMAFIAIGLFFAGTTRTVDAAPPGEIPPAGCNVCEELGTIDTNLGMINEKLDKMAPTWSQILPASERFELVMGDAAVLDRETGLVWEQSPDTGTRSWYQACSYCYGKEVGGRKGWRLPTIEELTSLVDPTSADPALPPGHPFSNVQFSNSELDPYWYWSSTTDVRIPDRSFTWSVNLGNGWLGVVNKDADSYNYVWCVRGGYGHDAY